MLEATVQSQLGGTIALEWQEPGLRCRITLPLNRGEAEPERRDTVQ